jgi:hypothetical protein
MSHSDYLFLKNKYETFNIDSSSSNTQKKQIQNIQNTVIINEDNEYVVNKRFNIPIKNYISINTTKKVQNIPMFSIPRIHVIEYIKNRYEPPFCWTCKNPIIFGDIACLVCEELDSSNLFDLQNLDLTNIDSSKYGQLFELSNVDSFIHLSSMR